MLTTELPIIITLKSDVIGGIIIHIETMKLPNPLSSSDGSSRLPSSPMDIVFSKLSQNALTELKLGYDGTDFQSKRDASVLLKIIQEKYLPHVVQDKYTGLESISVGWRLKKHALGPVLQQVIPTLLEHPKPVWIKHLKLDIDSWVPEDVLRRIVSKNTLISLDIRSTRIRTRCISDPRHNRGGGSSRGIGNVVRRRSGSGGAVVASTFRSTTSNSIRSASSSSSPSSNSPPIPDDNIVAILPHISPTVVSLRLVDCNLHNEDLELLCDWAKSRPRLQSLSIRHNRRIDPDLKLWKKLIGLQGLQSLDVSLCDLNPIDGDYIAKALLEQEKPPSSSLVSLSVAANYRMGAVIPELVQAASKTLAKLDCSFCDCQNQHLTAVFDYLANTPYNTLQILTMQGSRVKEGSGAALVNCVLQNKSLKSLRLTHPKGRTGTSMLVCCKDVFLLCLMCFVSNGILLLLVTHAETHPLDVSTLRELGFALQENYHLQVLDVDCERQYLKVIEPWKFWLDLNRCGRFILLNDNESVIPSAKVRKAGLGILPSYRRVLSKAAVGGDKNLLFWLVKYGAEQF